jgi:hypothetical protein
MHPAFMLALDRHGKPVGCLSDKNAQIHIAVRLESLTYMG